MPNPRTNASHAPAANPIAPAAAQPEAPDLIEIVDDPIDEFDPEGWMSERPAYWLDLPSPEPPTRLAWLRHRLAEAAARLGFFLPPDPAPRVSYEEWTRLSEMALGPLQHRDDFAVRREARPAAPDSRKSASKPQASSPTPRRPKARAVA